MFFSVSFFFLSRTNKKTKSKNGFSSQISNSKKRKDSLCFAFGD